MEGAQFREIGGWVYQRINLPGGKDMTPPPEWLMPILIRVVPQLRKMVKGMLELLSGLSSQTTEPTIRLAELARMAQERPAVRQLFSEIDNDTSAAVGVVAFQLFVMTKSWGIIYERASRLPSISNNALLYGVSILDSVVLAIALFIFVSRLYSLLTRQPLRQEMSRFGFAFLPLALMGHIGHNLGHFLNGYKLVPGAIAGLVGQTSSVPKEGLPNNWPYLALQIILVLIGLGMSIWALRGVCNSRRIICPKQPTAVPYVGLAV